MKEHPILFNDDMVRAILAGAKTQTRRPVQMPPSWDCIVYADHGSGWWPYRSDDGESPTYDNNEIPLRCPYGRPGDRLWVRETHRAIWGQTPGYLINVDYRADPPEKWERMRDHMGRPKWTPSIHMPREHSRITLGVANVRVERLRNISEADAQAEGFHGPMTGTDWMGINQIGRPPSTCYRLLWEKINGSGSWEANPWVWVIEFNQLDAVATANENRKGNSK